MSETDRLAGRNGQIWQKYISGRTMESLADEYGLTKGRISQIVTEVRDSIPEEKRADIVKRQVDFLEKLQADVAELFYAPLPPAFDKNGSILYDDEGKVVRDATGRLNALAGVLKVMDRHARLLGTDAATKLDANVTGADPTGAMLLAQEAARRLAEAGGGEQT